jgi:ATP-dependent helicase/DNAse subunit B
VHRALECIWEQLSNSKQLHALTQEQQTQLIEQAIARSINDMITPHTQLDGLVSLEAQRLTTLLHDWLALEKERPPFEVIAREKHDTITWQGMTFRVTIDRIDQLSQGGWLVIDYKTQSTHISHWFGDRLEEPQLPIYSLSQSQPIHGIAFAQVKPGQLTFKGVVHEATPSSDSITGCQAISQAKQPITQWEDCLQHWKTSLMQLVSEFKHGHAHVQPLNASSCRYCDCQPLCRIFEQ